MTRRLVVLAALALALTGCTARGIEAKFLSVKAHEFKEHGVVCYTFSASVSCVKVTP